jgi:hypothetical protein
VFSLERLARYADPLRAQAPRAGRAHKRGAGPRDLYNPRLPAGGGSGAGRARSVGGGGRILNFRGVVAGDV